MCRERGTYRAVWYYVHLTVGSLLGPMRSTIWSFWAKASSWIVYFKFKQKVVGYPHNIYDTNVPMGVSCDAGSLLWLARPICGQGGRWHFFFIKILVWRKLAADLISRCPMINVYSVFSNRILLISSSGKPRTMTIVCIFKTFLLGHLRPSTGLLILQPMSSLWILELVQLLV